MWSTVNAGWWPPAAAIAAIPLFLIFGGVWQFIAAMWSYRKGDTFAATWFGSMSGFFTSWAFYQLFTQLGVLHGVTDTTMINAVMFGCFGYIALFLALAALREHAASFAVLILLAASFALLMLDSFIGTAGWLSYTGGWCGIASAVIAFYEAAALVVNSVTMRRRLPLGSLSADGHVPGSTTGAHVMREQVSSLEPA